MCKIAVHDQHLVFLEMEIHVQNQISEYIRCISILSILNQSDVCCRWFWPTRLGSREIASLRTPLAPPEGTWHGIVEFMAWHAVKNHEKHPSLSTPPNGWTRTWYRSLNSMSMMNSLNNNLHEPSWTIMNHHEPSWTIMNYHEPTKLIIVYPCFCQNLGGALHNFRCCGHTLHCAGRFFTAKGEAWRFGRLGVCFRSLVSLVQFAGATDHSKQHHVLVQPIFHPAWILGRPMRYDSRASEAMWSSQVIGVLREPLYHLPRIIQ